MIETNDQGDRVYSGQLRLWLRTECPREETFKTAAPCPACAEDPFHRSFNVRETRLWVNCDKEKFWIEFEQLSKNGEVVNQHEAPDQEKALEAAGGGTIILPNSLLARVTDKYCRAAQSGTSVR
jgi:hypothetical protein